MVNYIFFDVISIFFIKKLPSLSAATAWTEDMEGYFNNNNLPVPKNVDWKLFANILLVAKMYE